MSTIIEEKAISSKDALKAVIVATIRKNDAEFGASWRNNDKLMAHHLAVAITSLFTHQRRPSDSKKKELRAILEEYYQFNQPES